MRNFIHTIGFLIYAVSCTPSAPVYDRFVGMTENYVFNKFGNPNDITVTISQDLGGELRRTVFEHYLAGAENIQVKEIYYNNGNNELIFWLIKDGASWKIVADAKVPKDTIY